MICNKQIKNILEAKFFNKVVEVIGPSEPYISKMNGKFQRKFLVKYKNIDDVCKQLCLDFKFLIHDRKENINI